MSVHARAVALASVVLLVLSAASASAKPVVGVQLGSLGAANTGRALDLVRGTRAKMVRVEATWSTIEPARKGERDPAALATLDETVSAAAARGLKVLLMSDSTPCWASAAPGAADGACAGAENYPPRDPQDFADFAAFLAARYGTRLAAFETWNEPDQSNQKYFAGPDKAVRYAALSRATYKAIKAAAPKVPVIAGAFVGNNGRFLRALYKAGFKGSYDALSVHFYDLTLFGVRKTRAVQRAFGDRKPMWLAESGWSSCRPAKNSPDGHLCTDRATQARNVSDLIAETRRTSYIAGLVIYALQDSSVDEFGLVDRSFQVKPVYAALRRALGPQPRAVTPTRVALRRSGGRVVATGSGPAADSLVLIAYKDGHARVRYRFRLDGLGRFRLPLPTALGTRGVSVRLMQEWIRRPVTATLR